MHLALDFDERRDQEARCSVSPQLQSLIDVVQIADTRTKI